jgi:hypothetical protein
VNPFGAVATDVRELARMDDPIGADNRAHIDAAIADADVLVPCWGSRTKVPKLLRGYFAHMLNRMRLSGKPILIFGLTQSGDPMHPLMLGYDTQLIEWAPFWQTPTRPRVDNLLGDLEMSDSIRYDVPQNKLAGVLNAAFHLSRPQGLGFLNFDPDGNMLPEFEAHAKEAISADTSKHFLRSIHLDYVQGRACKFSIHHDSDGWFIEGPRWYDHSEEQLLELVRLCGLEARATVAP